MTTHAMHDTHICPTCGRPTDPSAISAPPCGARGAASTPDALTDFERDRLDGKGSHRRGMDRLLDALGVTGAVTGDLPLVAIGPGGIGHPDTKLIHGRSYE